jgi:signal transduction histidine kinase
MTRSLTFATRIGLIVVLGLVMAWIMAIAVYYVGGRGADLKPLSDPTRVAAIVELMERTPAAEYELVLRAINADGFAVDVEPGTDVGANSTAVLSAFSERTVQSYLDALPGRNVSVEFDETQRRRVFRRLWPDILKLRIALSSGHVLAITVGTPLLRGPLGLPIGFGAGIIGTLVALIALLVMHRETKPLARLAEAVDRVDLSPDPVLLPEAKRSAPEICALIDAFNRLQERLSELLKSRMAMLGGISHDVRTFATRLHLRVEKIADPVERERAITDINDMIRLLDDALLASRAGAAELSEEMIEIDDLIRSEVSDRQANGARIDFHPTTGLHAPVVLGDRLALRRVIANLADNAIKYGHAAHLGTAIQGTTFILIVDDEGTGIPARQRKAMMEPFSRLETSRSRDTGGAGLGLAIARGLTEAHRGTLSIAQASSGGARVIVRLPLFQPV